MHSFLERTSPQWHPIFIWFLFYIPFHQTDQFKRLRRCSWSSCQRSSDFMTKCLMIWWQSLGCHTKGELQASTGCHHCEMLWKPAVWPKHEDTSHQSLISFGVCALRQKESSLALRCRRRRFISQPLIASWEGASKSNLGFGTTVSWRLFPRWGRDSIKEKFSSQPGWEKEREREIHRLVGNIIIKSLFSWAGREKGKDDFRTWSLTDSWRIIDANHMSTPLIANLNVGTAHPEHHMNLASPMQAQVEDGPNLSYLWMHQWLSHKWLFGLEEGFILYILTLLLLNTTLFSFMVYLRTILFYFDILFSTAINYNPTYTFVSASRCS